MLLLCRRALSAPTAGSCRRLLLGLVGPSSAAWRPHAHRRRAGGAAQLTLRHSNESGEAPTGADDDHLDGASDGPGPGPSSSGLLSSLQTLGQRQSLDPGLYLVATPIGNLQDITLRALNVLRSANLILAEDTRHTGKLLAAYGIRTPMASYHAHNEEQRSRQVVARLQGGEVLALVSDAGMPGISDPGYVLVQAAIEAGVRVVPVPGACALVAALVASGLPTESFTFCGFLPPKQGARRARLQQLQSLTSTLLFYAPPHGLRAVLADMAEVLGGARRVCVARELSKMHEEFFRSSLHGALEEFTRREPKGEICVVVQGCDADASRYAALVQGLQEAEAEAGGPAGSGESRIPGGSEPDLEAEAGSGPGAVASARGQGSMAALLQPDAPVLDTLLSKLLRSGMPTKAAAKEAARLVPGLGRKEAYAAALRVAEQTKAGGGRG